MKHVVTAALPALLVTAFGAFPGAPSNPTLAMLRLLEKRGIDGLPLRFAELPVTFAGVAPALRAAAACRPSAILLLGLARRRTRLSVETRARNRAGTATPDNDGAVPHGSQLVEGGTDVLAATWPATEVLQALQAGGHEAALSDDGGDYVCNAALYHALHERLAPRIGFLHVPPLDVRGAGRGPSVEELADAARAAIGAMARCAGTWSIGLESESLRDA